MPRELYTLLPVEEVEKFYYPKIPLRDAVFATSVMGNLVGNVPAPFMVTQFSERHDSSYSRDPFKTDRGDANVFKPYLQLNGKGVLSAIHGLKQPMYLRITVDGESSVTFTNNWNYGHLAWGYWSEGSSWGSVGGFYFFKDRETITEEYRQNFFKGGVHFENQLKIEYANMYSWSSRQTLTCDYLIGDEL